MKLNYIKLMLLFVISSISQTSFSQLANAVDPKEKELKVGDKVPDIVLENIINATYKSAKLSQFKGKLVILDFWATWCVPCVQALPKMDSLQNHFGEKIAIIPITAEKTENVAKFLKTTKSLENLSLPVVTLSKLSKIFPHRIVPHEIWIDKNGVILAITGHEEVTKQNIQNYINGKQSELLSKNDIMVQDISKPLLVGGLGDYKFTSDQLLYTSIITEGFEGVASMTGYGYGTTGNIIYMRSNNVYLQNLYKAALVRPSVYSPDRPNYYTNKDFYLMNDNRIIWEAKDSSYFSCNETKAYLNTLPYKRRVFNYELRLPVSDTAKIRNEMLYDLNRYFGSRFGIEGLREKRRVKCWSLTIIGPERLFKSKGGPKIWGADRSKIGFRINNYKIEEFMYGFIGFNLPWDFKIPVINETGYSGSVDLDLGDIDPTNFEQINTELKSKGLEFKLVERELEMIIIRDKAK